MAHELRTPATIIYSGARLLTLRGEMLSPEDRRGVVDGIELESERMAVLVDDILTFARIEAGHNGSLHVVPMTEMVRRSVASFRGRHPERPLSCSLEQCSVMGQERYVEMVLRHLLANSEAYSPATSPIQVTLTRQSSTVTLSVIDHGPGLPRDQLNAIFEPYYRGRLPAGTRGLGLGLAFCRRIVEAMHGHISAALPYGGGLEVSFTLPAA
jgi:two-component system sensor histidine kinase KdpD